MQIITGTVSFSRYFRYKVAVSCRRYFNAEAQVLSGRYFSQCVLKTLRKLDKCDSSDSLVDINS